jgi:phosphoglycolate phosphatase
MDGNAGALRRLLPEALVVLDWNGTTVDDAARTRAALNAALARFGVPALDAGAYTARFRLPMAAMLADLGVPEAHLAAAIRAWNDEIATREAPLAAGAAELLRGLRERGRPGGVISAAATAVVEAEARRLGIFADLAFLIGDAEPKSAPLRDLVANATGPVLYVGDTEYDVAEALAAGAVPVGFAGGYRPAAALLAAGAIASVDNLADLLDRGEAG